MVFSVPLGVLKMSVGVCEGEGRQRKEGVVRFVPALPERKAAVIRAMGFGLLNKVVMSFDCKFWHEEEGAHDFSEQSAQIGA